MTKIVKVLDKGGQDGKVKAPRKVLERYALDAREIVNSDPERFEILEDGDETPIDQDLLGNAVRHKRGRKVEANADAKSDKDE